jgi:signal peptidase II
LTVALGLIMAGALGNCYDRLVFGHVRDFVHFHIDAIGFDCAIFNFADNMLVAGAVTLVLYAMRPENRPATSAVEPVNTDAVI